ncbi:tyrosine-type recombinase/integrase [Cohnella lupini]|uniref:Site-specific recombinase XerD n=1 Tax=Cohnella lupini TaxID=1294267 RepID=A0A3D9HZA4_9BACL|nr:site-specific integrase [Cohnella lupini]RED54765.1 site-specific recombinase XerD [Cohnella lupini]
MVRKRFIAELPPGVRKRGNGFTYRYDVPVVRPDGSPDRKQKETMQFPTPLDAYQAGVLIEAEQIKGTYVDEDNVLFTEWAPKAIELHAYLNGIKRQTKDMYLHQLVRAKEYFVGRKLKDITDPDYQLFLMFLHKDLELDRGTISMIHAKMKIIFRMGKKHKLIANNPTEDAKIPADEVSLEDMLAPEIPRYLEKEELALLIRTMKVIANEQTDQLETFGWNQAARITNLLSRTGLRIGESMALIPSNFDLTEHTIRVVATVNVSKGMKNYFLSTPKNKKPRTVDITNSVISTVEEQVKAVKALRLMFGPSYYRDHAFIFINYKHLPGYPIGYEDYADKLKIALSRAGLPESITPHKLRHTYTSLGAEAGMTLEEIQAQLGHSKDEVTKRIYLHVTQARRKTNADRLEQLLSPHFSE